MDRTINGKEIAAGFAVAAATLCLGFYLSVLVRREDVSTLFLRGFGLLAIGIVLKYTFALGRLRGFPVRREDSSIDVSNLLRNLVAAAIVLFCVVFLSGPFIAASIRFAR
jgi:hypothetical protein